MQKVSPFSLDDPSIDELAKRLAKLYANVSLSRDPMFSWVQITNDVTILGEDLRRNRESEAVRRAGKILIRLLEFLGYYLYIYKPRRRRIQLADELARALRAKSYSNSLPAGPAEGPTRWVVVKYPFACSKCGRAPCHCSVYPGILENRREDREPYIRRFEKPAANARSNLRTSKISSFTIESLLRHFERVYGNQYVNQEPWKLGMHLAEEVGEATIELSRIDLSCRARQAGFKITRELLDRIIEIAKGTIHEQTGTIRDKLIRDARRHELETELKTLGRKMRSDPWRVYGRLVRDKFKEEVSDVFSWLAAVIVKLDPDLKQIGKLPGQFVSEGDGKMKFLGCKWCHRDVCSNACLVTHGISSEIVEKISKF